MGVISAIILPFTMIISKDISASTRGKSPINVASAAYLVPHATLF